MVEVRVKDYQGYEVVEIFNDEISLLVTVSTGPRILSLTAFGHQNLFAELPDAVLEYPGEGDLHLIGGHRLWYAPEDPATTYIPDNFPVSWDRTESGVTLVQPVDRPTQVQKKIAIELAEDGALVKINHELVLHGENQSFVMAPWGITQLRTGGKAVLPLQNQKADPYGLLPNRNIVLWPYTDLNSPYLRLDNEAIYVTAKIEEGALKVGSPNPAGWLGYELDGQLFIKRTSYHEDRNYLDLGASSQIYCNQDFIELETLGPTVNLKSGESVFHLEEWQIFNLEDRPPEIASFF